MSEAAGVKFSCDECGRTYAWKEQLAGKRVKCKCGTAMTVPDATPEPEFDPDALYELAEATEKAAQEAPSQHRVVESRPKPAAQPPGKSPGATGGGIPRSATALAVGYQRGPTAQERNRNSMDTIIDMKRDVYAPVGFLLAGFVIYVAFYMFRYDLTGGGVALVTIGLGVMTVFKAALLFGFALLIAGPLGVSFGGIFTAALKLAAIAIFSDGLLAWADHAVTKMAGGIGGLSGFMTFPIPLITYWLLMTYLFSMDPGDSWLVVIILAVFDFIIRWAILLILLNIVLGWGGVSGAALPIATGGAPPVASESVQEFNELKEAKALVEAREFIKGGRQEAWMPTVDALYAAGAKKVYFATGRDFEGKIYPASVVVEMPRDKASRDKCLNAVNDYYRAVQAGMAEPGDDDDDPAATRDRVTDDNEPVMFLPLQ